MMNILSKELVVDAGLVGVGEALLVLVVAVTEVVAVAGVDKVPAVGLVGGGGAAIRGPDEVARRLVVAVAEEAAEGEGPHLGVGGGHLGGLGLTLLDGGISGGRGGHDAAGHGEGADDGGELHFDG